MEALDEHERYEEKVLPRDLPPMTYEQIALQALIDKWSKTWEETE